MTDTTTIEREAQTTEPSGARPLGGRRARGPATSTRTGPVFDPARGIVQKEVRLASTDDVSAAVAIASAAFAEWRDASIAKRQTVLFAFRELLNARKQELAEILTSEHGKVLSDALGEIARGIEVVEFACGLGRPHQGRLLRERLDRHRRLLAASAARRRGDHQPVQLPRDGAAVVLLASRSPPATPWC